MARNGIQDTFGKAVREARTTVGISQEELADRSGLHRTYISLLERGQRNPSLAVIEEISHALGISMVDLVGRIEKQRVRR